MDGDLIESLLDLSRDDLEKVCNGLHLPATADDGWVIRYGIYGNPYYFIYIVANFFCGSSDNVGSIESGLRLI